MGWKIENGNGTTEVSISDGELAVMLPQAQQDAAFVALTCESHPTENGVTREMYSVETNDDHNLRTTEEESLFWFPFSGAAVNTTVWRQGSATATITQSAGFLTLNAGLSTASGAAAVVTSYPFFEAIPTSNLYWSAQMQFGQGTHPANCVCEWGLAIHNAGAGTGTTEPTDGVYFRLTAGGAFEGVVRAGGSNIAVATITASFATIVGGSISREFVVSISDSTARFWIDDACVAVLQIPTNAPSASGWTTTRTLQSHFRIHNTGVTATAQSIRVGEMAVKRDNIGAPMLFAHASAGAGQSATQGQTGETLGTTASFANSADPTAAAALSNTAALVTGLGGQARFNAAATAVTDGIVTSYQVPGATSTVAGRGLYVTGIKISSANLGAAVATTATTLSWSIAYGHTAVSLATTEAAAAKAPRRVALGLQTWPVAAAIGAMPQNGDLYMPFDSPIVVYPGEFFAVVAKFIVGTATASQVIWSNVTIDGYRR